MSSTDEIDYKSIKKGAYIAGGSDGAIFDVELGTFNFQSSSYVMKMPKYEKFDQEKVDRWIKLKHRNVISLYKYCVDPYCLIMDKCLGDLKDVIDGKALINAGDFKDYTTQIANGMKYLHSQNVAHRDLKPENVLITTESTIKICDFDRSKAFVVYMSTYAGTPLWMAPEMLTGKKYTKEVDVWSFAVVVWEMLTQRLPYESLFNDVYKTSHLTRFSNDLSRCQIRLPFPVGTPQLMRILLSECLLSVPYKRPNFETIVSCLASLEIEGDHWTALKPLWREIPLDYTYSKEEENDFVMRREYLTSTGKRWEELIENITRGGEDLENKIWNLETIKEIINKREGLTWEWDISYWAEFALEEPNAQNLRHLLNDNKFLECDYNDYINKIKPKVLCNEATELSMLTIGNGNNVKVRILASEVLFHVIQSDTRSPEEMVELIISSVKAEEDVELVMNCSILLTLPIMREVFSLRSWLFLSNALRIHLKNAKMTNLFWFIQYEINDSLRRELTFQMVETGLVEAIMKSLVSSEDIENILIRNWWRILFMSTLFNQRSSLIFIENGGIQCFHEHKNWYWNDPWILHYIFGVINNVVIDSSPRSQFLTNEFVEEHFRFLRLNSEHAPVCHITVFILATLLDESMWAKVKMSKSSCSKSLVKIITAWSITIKWSDVWKPVLSIDDNEVLQSYIIFRLLKIPLLSFSSADRSENLESLEALINDSKTTDDLRMYAKLALLLSNEIR